MGFESAGFKLSYEMTELIDPGGTRQSREYLRFTELCIKGFLAVGLTAFSICEVFLAASATKYCGQCALISSCLSSQSRKIADAIVATASMMESSQLPCFGRGRPILELKHRFHLEMNDVQAAAFMRGMVNDAYDKWTTGAYDYIQYLQQNIPK
jgi:phosphatidylinositol 4-kinase